MYGDEEAVEYMLDSMKLSPSGMELKEWLSLEDEPVKFMRVDIKDCFYDVPDWEIIRNAEREDIEQTEISLFGQASA